MQVVVTEVARSVETSNVQWVVETLRKASPALLAVRPTGVGDEYLGLRQRVEITTAIRDGFALLSREAVRPAHYSEKALERVRDLAGYVGKGLTSVTVGTTAADQEVELGQQIVQNVSELLQANMTSWGTVEGRLESVTVHRGREFSIYDALTSQRIRCSFGRRISPADIGKAVERRVSVYGEIRARASGTIVSVIAQALEPLPTEAELPPAHEAIGVLKAST